MCMCVRLSNKTDDGVNEDVREEGERGEKGGAR